MPVSIWGMFTGSCLVLCLDAEQAGQEASEHRCHPHEQAGLVEFLDRGAGPVGGQIRRERRVALVHCGQKAASRASRRTRLRSA